MLHEPIPERALYVPADEGAAKAHCFTNYEPHFNPSQRLDNVIMGSHEGWRLASGKEAQAWSDPEGKYGYKDTKPFYEVSIVKFMFVCSFFFNVGQRESVRLRT